ncbi:MAG: hypothetical protein ABI778_10650, partial [Ignavibacteriota bacterium]
MKVLTRISITFLLLLVLSAATNVAAQWKEMAHTLFTIKISGSPDSVVQGGRGVLFFYDGVLFAGVNA